MEVNALRSLFSLLRTPEPATPCLFCRRSDNLQASRQLTSVQVFSFHLPGMIPAILAQWRAYLVCSSREYSSVRVVFSVTLGTGSAKVRGCGTRNSAGIVAGGGRARGWLAGVVSRPNLPVKENLRNSRDKESEEHEKNDQLFAKPAFSLQRNRSASMSPMVAIATTTIAVTSALMAAACLESLRSLRSFRLCRNDCRN